MEILWFAPRLEILEGNVSSQLASVRLRCIEIANYINQQEADHKVHLLKLGKKVVFEEDLLAKADIAVFGKVPLNLEPLCNFLISRGVPIIFDLCEDVFSHPVLGSVYDKLWKHTSGVVASSLNLVNLVRKETGIECVLMEDAIECKREEVNLGINNDRLLKLVWFGQPVHLRVLESAIGDLANWRRKKLSLEVVTRIDEAIPGKLQRWKNEHGKRINFKLTPWTIEDQQKAISNADVVIIPSDDSQFMQAKTVNRLATGIWAGKPVVAYPVESYRQMEDFAYLNVSIVDGLDELLDSSRNEVECKIKSGQDYIEQHFSPAILARKWLGVCEEILGTHSRKKNTERLLESRRQESEPSSNESLVKLNLGCGDKILPGYINVDLVDERAGNQPDVRCDIRDLDVFDEDYADEVLTVHVIEHFYYWEAQSVLEEWVRVLKPGGKMIIECPNLLSACEEILKDPINTTGPGSEGQRSMWVLYGDPAWKDPLMCHKWLYTPDSLRKLMESCGLESVHQEPAQFKLREPRDMRMVGIKSPSIQ